MELYKNERRKTLGKKYFYSIVKGRQMVFYSLCDGIKLRYLFLNLAVFHFHP